MSAEADLWPSEAWSSAADVYLLAQARDGSAEAYGELWRRHLSAAYAVAARHRGRAAPEDIVAEASARVLDLIRRGKGPEEHFRAYFLSTVRTVATDHARRDLRIVPAEAEQLEVLAEPVTEDFDTDELDPTLVREAFAGLSERDQRVLWHTTVEGEAPRAVAPRLGLSPNAVSARAMRAREALRPRYLDAHAQRHTGMADSDECRWAIEQLGAHVRGRLPKRQAERVRKHLDSCTRTAELAAELEQIRSGFPALLVPLVLLAGVSTPGFVSVGALGALGGEGATAGLRSGGDNQAPPSDAVRDLTSHLTTLAAGFAIGVGVVGAGASVPAAPVPAAPVVALPTPAGSAPAQTVPPAPPPPVTAPGVDSSAPPPAAAVPVPAGAAPTPLSAAVPPPRVVRPRAPSPPTTALVTRSAAPALAAPALVAPAPVVPVPTSSPTGTGTATPSTPPTTPPSTPVPATTTTPAPTTTTPVPTQTRAPSLVIGWHLLSRGQPEVELTFTGPDGEFVPVSVVVAAESKQGTLEQHSKRHHCVVVDNGRSLTCTVTGPAPLVVRQLDVEAFEPLVVTASTADGETATVTIRTADR